MTLAPHDTTAAPAQRTELHRRREYEVELGLDNLAALVWRTGQAAGRGESIMWNHAGGGVIPVSTRHQVLLDMNGKLEAVLPRIAPARGKDFPMRLRLLFLIPVALALAACASVQPSSNAYSTPAKEASVQPSPSSSSAAPTSPQVGTPELTPQQVADRLLALIDSLRTPQDINPDTLKRFMGNVRPDNNDPRLFYSVGDVSQGSWFYSLTATNEKFNDPPRTLQFIFNPQIPSHEPDESDLDITPISTPSFEYYRQRLVERGFSAKELGSTQPNHDGPGFEWDFSRGNVYITLIRYDLPGVRPFFPSQAVHFVFINIHDHPIPTF